MQGDLTPNRAKPPLRTLPPHIGGPWAPSHKKNDVRCHHPLLAELWRAERAPASAGPGWRVCARPGLLALGLRRRERPKSMDGPRSTTHEPTHSVVQSRPFDLWFSHFGPFLVEVPKG